MELPEAVLQTYRMHFREIREIAGGSLHSVLEQFGKLDDSLRLLLDRVVDWRGRYCDELLEPDRMIAAYSGVRAEVQNGGFHQYFSNSSGDLWPDLLRLLELGGDSEGEAHLRKVLTCFPDSSPAMNRDQRELQLDDLDGTNSAGEFTDPFEELDAQYDVCFYPVEETLFKALRAIHNIEDFIPNPDEI